MHVDRVVISNRAMESVLVIVPRPIPQPFPGIGKVLEPVGVQTFCPRSAVEGRDEPTVSQFPRPREVQRDVLPRTSA
jgi:hypothetical protein